MIEIAIGVKKILHIKLNVVLNSHNFILSFYLKKTIT